MCTQPLPLPPGVEVISCAVAGGHLSSASIYPACFAPYQFVTACSDGEIRFWCCNTASVAPKDAGVCVGRLGVIVCLQLPDWPWKQAGNHRKPQICTDFGHLTGKHNNVIMCGLFMRKIGPFHQLKIFYKKTCYFSWFCLLKKSQCVLFFEYRIYPCAMYNMRL